MRIGPVVCCAFITTMMLSMASVAYGNPFIIYPDTLPLGKLPVEQLVVRVAVFASIEAILMLLLTYRMVGSHLWVFLAVLLLNTFTMPAMWTLISVYYDQLKMPWVYAVELFPLVVETLGMWLFFDNLYKRGFESGKVRHRDAFFFVLFSNVMTFILGAWLF